MSHLGNRGVAPLADNDDLTKTDNNKMSAFSPAVLRRTALLIDGVARAALFPFGPRLIHRLLSHKEMVESSTWSEIAYPVAIVTGVYTLGRALGEYMAAQFPVDKTKAHHYVARLGGLSVALHVFAFGAGLGTVRSLVWIRFLAALSAGYCCGITDCPLPEDKAASRVGSTNETELMEQGGLRRTTSEDSTASRNGQARAAYFYVAPGTIKIYMTGFAVSILVGGLLFRHVSNSIVLQAYAGGYPLTLSPVFFLAVAALAEASFRVVLWLASNCAAGDFPDELSPQEQSTNAVRRLVSRVVNRGVNNALTPNRGRIGSSDRRQMDEHRDPLSLSRHRHSSHGMRTRLNSAKSETSMSEFFDCHSAFSDEVVDLDADPLTGDALYHEPSETERAVYKDCMTVYEDGTPAFVPQGECIADIPENYLEFCSNNPNKAQRMWTATRQWRRDKEVWKIHRVPHPCFAEIKRAYPHFIHGHSKQGYPIIYEQPGKMNLKEFFRNGGEISEMVMHYTFMMEYISNCTVTQDEILKLKGSDRFEPSAWGTMVVMDVQGASLTSLSGDVIKYLKQAGDINSSHYPHRLKRAFVVNSPFWLAGPFSSIKGILPESVHVELLSASNYLENLRQFIDDDQIPPEYGGSSPYPLGHHPYEEALKEMVAKSHTFEQEYEIGVRSRANSREEELIADMSLSSFVVEASQDSGLLSPMKASSSQPLRRRTSSYEARTKFRTSNYPSTIEEENSQGGDELSSAPDETGILTILTFMYLIFCGIQGAVEISVPLWVLSPAVLGGLGYSPSRSGVAMFSASVVLLWVMRTKVVRALSQMPIKEPMRAFRVGVGSESALLSLIPFIPTLVTSTARTDSVLIMTSTIILLSCLAVAGMLGRAAAGVLHRMASSSYSAQAHVRSRSWMTILYGRDRLVADCESGRFTAVLRILGEVLGMIVVAPLFSWSTSLHRPFPLDAACSFYVTSLVAFVLYVSSFSLYINGYGEFAPHPRDGCGDAVDTRRCCSFVGEVIAVSAGDMSSLLEEANWKASPLLGYCPKAGSKKSGSLSSSAMERGEAGAKTPAKAI